MKKNLSDNDYTRLNELIAKTEENSGAQIVLALIDRCDSYAELPWKAFAFGVSLAGFVSFIWYLPIYRWGEPAIWAIQVILATGALFALLTILIPGVARLFLNTHRTETEVRQYAQALFLERELFATRNRRGVLLLIALFEKRIEILPDRGLTGQLADQTLQSVTEAMIPSLKQNEIFPALETGMQQLDRLLQGAVKDNGENELPDQIIEEKGI